MAARGAGQNAEPIAPWNEREIEWAKKTETKTLNERGNKWIVV
jgi:hypothetical protein